MTKSGPMTEEEITKDNDQLLRNFLRVASVIILVTVGPFIWRNLDISGWVYHDEMTTVYSPDWQSGEYKTCTTLNGSVQQNILCDGGVPSGQVSDGKLFMVRFWGKTYDEAAPHIGSGPDIAPKMLVWNCRKNESGDPAITCHQTTGKQPNS